MTNRSFVLHHSLGKHRSLFHHSDVRGELASAGVTLNAALRESVLTVNGTKVFWSTKARLGEQNLSAVEVMKRAGVKGRQAGDVDREKSRGGREPGAEESVWGHHYTTEQN